jgi:large subunit ribosomal protein L13
MKTAFAKKTAIEKKWHVVDADGLVVGRLATQVATILRGKNKPVYTPHVDTGDYVIVLNAGKVRFTGKKLDNKEYFRHTGYPGGIRSRTARQIMKETPEKIIISAVRGMLPKNTLGRQQMKKLKVYRGTEHPHGPQSPEALHLKT